MNRFFLCVVLFTCLGLTGVGQTFWGQNGYIEYRQGVLPIVISVPHGGDLQPASIPDRTCNNAVTVTDANTVDLALEIDSALFAETGCHPHLIICHLKRTKLDCNRNLSDGACGNSEAATAWNEFQDFIVQAQQTALDQHGEKVFYIDLHGHGNPVRRVELGYLLYEDELELSDATLNSAQYVGYSSIQHLVDVNLNGSTHAELLRGPSALGTLLEDNGYPAVPSQQDPAPGLSSNYFSGGYNTLNHTSYDPGNLVDGVQMECNYTGVRDTEMNRSYFATALVGAMSQYLNVHHGIVIANGGCGIGGIPEDYMIDPPSSLVLYNNELIPYLAEKGIQSWKLVAADGNEAMRSGETFSGLLSSGTYFMLPLDGEPSFRPFRVVILD
jgi:hypothetical protein